MSDEKQLIFIFDKNDKTLAITNEYTSAYFEEDLSGDKVELNITMPYDKDGAEFLVGGNQVAFKDLEGTLRLFVIRENDDEDGETTEKKVLCLPAIDELADNYVGDLRPQDKTADYVIEQILAGTRWQKGNIASLGNNSTNFYYVYRKDAIMKVPTIWGGEIKDRITVDDTGVSGRFVDLLTRRGADRGKIFDINKDVKSIIRTAMFYPKTALVGRGSSLPSGDGFSRKITFEDAQWIGPEDGGTDPVTKLAGQEWVGDYDALEKYGIPQGDGSKQHRFGLYENGDIEDPAELLRVTYNAMLENKDPKVRYKMSVITFYGMAGYEHEIAYLGDTGFIDDSRIKPSIKLESRINRVKYDIGDPFDGEVTIGNFIDLNEHQKRIDWVVEKVENNSGSWEVSDVNDQSFPDTVPPTPSNVSAKGIFKTIKVEWDFVADSYIAAYEVYASQIVNFTPDSSNLVFRGKTGGLAFEAGNDEQWYFRVRAINTHGTFSPFSAEVSAQTVKISDVDFDELTVVDEYVHNISADVLVGGQIDATNVDVINLNADNFVAGMLKAKYVQIGTETTFESGYDPAPVIRKLQDDSFQFGKDFWSDDFEGKDVGPLTPGTLIDSIEAKEGSNILEFQGKAYMYGKNPIPVDVSRTYRLTFRVRQTIDPTVLGTSNVLAGVATLDKDYVNLTGGSGTHRYCAAAGVSVVVADDWQVFTGIISGVGDNSGNFRDGTKFIRPMAIVNYQNGDGTAQVDVVRFEDITIENDFETRINGVEIKTTDNSIIQTVSESVEFKGKADASALADYATNDQLDQAKSDGNEYTDKQIDDIDFSPYATHTEVEQTASDLDFKFSSSGGVNILKNSVGYAGSNFWTLTLDKDGQGQTIGTFNSLQNPELVEQGSGSGFQLVGAKLSQTISTVSDFYTIATVLKKGLSGSGYMKIMYDNTSQIIQFSSGIEYIFEQSLITIEPIGNEVIVELYGDTNGGIIFTNTMANVGNTALQWQHSAGEVYNSNVLFDLNGIQVFSDEYEGYTSITPKEFSGYAEVDGVMQRVFSQNKDVTEMSKASITKEIDMSPVKVVPVSSFKYNGWAFVPDGSINENLITNSDFSDGTTGWLNYGSSSLSIAAETNIKPQGIEVAHTIIGTDGYGIQTPTFEMLADTVYTLSFTIQSYYNLGYSLNYMYLRNGVSPTTIKSLSSIDLSKSPTVYNEQYTWRVTILISNDTTLTDARVLIGLYGDSVNNQGFILRETKAEKGNKRTQYVQP